MNSYHLSLPYYALQWQNERKPPRIKHTDERKRIKGSNNTPIYGIFYSEKAPYVVMCGQHG